MCERLDGDWQAETSALPDGRGIRVGFLSQLELTEVEQALEFPDQLAPVQVDDEGATVAQMGRGVLRVRVSAQGRDVDLVNCHLKSKLLTFPGGRFKPRDEASAHASAPMPSTREPRRRSPCAARPTSYSTARAATARS